MSQSAAAIASELAAKKERVALLKKQREERLASSAQGSASVQQQPSASTGASASAAKKNDDIESILQSVDSLIPKTVASSASGSGGSQSASAGGAGASHSAQQHQHARARSGYAPTLVLSGVLAESSIPPKALESYSKEVQTDQSAVPHKGSERDAAGNEGGAHDDDDKSKDRKKDGVAEAREMTPLEKSQIVESKEFAQFFSGATALVLRELGFPPDVNPMGAAERKEVEAREDFAAFLRHSSLLVERALGAQFDPFVDYAAEKKEADPNGASGGVTLLTTFFDERWCRHRIVTDLNWSPTHPELVVAAYGAKEDLVSQDPDGVALVWSLLVKTRPVLLFTSQSAVTSVLYSPFSANFIVGTTFSGQVVLWDVRAKSTPVQRSPISSAGHTHPVYAMSIVGTQNAHNLVTASMDGHLCVWSLDKLVTPQESLDLVRVDPKPKNTTRRDNPEGISTTCIAFADGEVNSFIAGTEEGSLYECMRHGNKPGVQSRVEAHHGPVTSVDIHPHGDHLSPEDLSFLFLTTSIDWTCKLWSRRHPAVPIAVFEAAGDYVYQAKWSPVHPALFATVDGSGHLDIWNLLRDTEVPLRTLVSTDSALNSLRWSADGRRIAVGDSKGLVTVFSLPNELALPQSPAETYNAFLKRIEEMEDLVKNEVQDLPDI